MKNDSPRSRRSKLTVSKAAENACYHAFQSGVSPIELVIDQGIDPLIVQHCYKMFLRQPYRPEDKPGEHGPILIPLRFSPSMSAWMKAHDISISPIAWLQAAAKIVASDPALDQRAHHATQKNKRNPERLAREHGIEGDAWFLAVFELVYSDPELRRRCTEAAQTNLRAAAQTNPNLS